MARSVQLLVDEQYRQCVVFLYADTTDPISGLSDRRPVGTGFLVSMPLPGREIEVALYVVTARHIVDMTRGYGLHPLIARINAADGGYQDIPMPDAAWNEHPTNDVAVGSLVGARYDRSRPLDLKHIGLELFLTADVVRERVTSGQPVGLGDDVFFTGLFTPHPGVRQNQPVIRFGSISLMPQEKVRVTTDDRGSSALIDAYLVEARSQGGHSGSPAFHFNRIDVNTLVGAPAYSPRLLGVVQGHFEAPSDPQVLGDLGGEEGGGTQENAGMAVVVPAQFIVDLLHEGDLTAERVAFAQRLSEGTARPDTTHSGAP